MRLEGFDGLFGGIAVVNIWRDELILCVSFVFDVGFEVCTGLVVEDLKVHCEAAFGEALHD